jgi:hypothetical protein
MRGRVAALIGMVVVVVVVGLVVVLTRVGDDADPSDDAQRPAFAVLKPKDAAYAVQGDDGDFEVVHEVSPSDGDNTEAILPDGRLVVMRAQELDYYLDLVDPATGEREVLPAPWIEDDTEIYPVPTVLDDSRLVVAWRYSEHGESQDRVMMLDLATGLWEESARPSLTLPRGVKFLSYPLPAGDGRFYIQTGKQLCGDGECFTPRRGGLWSFAPGDDAARSELEGVEEFAVSGDLLAWVPDSPESTIRVRDLASGEEHRYAIRGLCTLQALIASTSFVVALCPNQERQIVIDAAARPVVDLRVGYGYPSVGDRWILASPFAYDTQTGRLLRLFDREGGDATRELRGDLAVVPLGPEDSGYSGTLDYKRWAVVRFSDR